MRNACAGVRLESSAHALQQIISENPRLLPKKILKGPSELNAENLGAQHMK